MIEIRDYRGSTHFVSTKAIAQVTEASTSSKWHGIRSIVKLFDGSVIESSDTAEEISKSVQRELQS